MSMLLQLIYTSTAAINFDDMQLRGLLEKCVERNTLAGVTGLLLYKDWSFMQVLEGDERVVKAVYSRISRDPRHHNIIELLREPIEERVFPDYAMAFPDRNAPELLNTFGYSYFLNTPYDGELLRSDIPKCKRMLLEFKRNIR